MNVHFDAISAGQRMAEERERLGYRKRQADFAVAIGVRREMISRYEGGKATPAGDVLAKLVAIGADVPYILTGIRTIQRQEPPPAPETTEELSQQERVIVAKLRMLPQQERDEIEDLVEKVEQAEVAKATVRERFRKAS